MINWQSILFNAFWIFGLAVLLAGFSYTYWLAGETQQSVRQQLAKPSFLKLFWFSLICIGIGGAGTSSQLWETALWLIFSLACGVIFARLMWDSYQEE